MAPSSESDWTDVGDIPRTDTSYTITDLDPDTAYVGTGACRVR